MKKNFSVLLLALVLGISIHFTALAQGSTEAGKIISPDTSAIENARVYIDSLIQEQNLPGFSISVAKNNKTIWSKGFGFADISKQIPVDPEKTLFRVGSLSKLFTSAAAVLLYQNEKIDLNAPIDQYHPNLPEQLNQITAMQLAGHLSGIRHYNRNEYINRVTYHDVNESLSIFINDTLRSAPGTTYSYSSYGYNLFGAVIQEASGTEFRTYISQHLLKPLGLGSTYAEHPDMPQKNRAVLYSQNQEGAFEQAIHTDLTDRWPSGGYWSTADDIAHFGIGLLNSDLFTPESRKLLFTPQYTIEGVATNVGMAWRVGKNESGQTIFHHGGDSIGGRAFILMVPEEGVVITMLSNMSFAGFGEKEALEIARIFE